MKKNNKTKSLTLEEIEAIPIEERTQEEWELLEQYFFETATPQERERAEKISKRLYEAMDYYFKKVREKEQALKGKEAELKKRETKLETEKKKLEEDKLDNFRVSKHFIEERTRITPLKNIQRDLFRDYLNSDDTEGKIEIPDILGIDLTVSETKMTNCFARMVHQRSQTFDPTQENYYSGDIHVNSVIKYGGVVTAPSPRLEFTLYEIAKEYNGGTAPSGPEMKTVENILNGLLTKTVLIDRVVEVTKDHHGKKGRYRITKSEPLIARVERLDTPERGKGQNITIFLSAIFELQNDTYYITYPSDINERIEEAHGSKRVPKAVLRLIDYLQTVKGVQNNYSHTIYRSNLYNILNPTWLKRKQIKIPKDETNKAIEIAKKIGLVKECKEVIGATGEQKLVFTFNKEWISKEIK